MGIITVRLNIWQTNSSGVHDLIFDPKIPAKLDYPSKDKICIIPLGEYGQGPEDLTTWEQKASYLLSMNIPEIQLEVYNILHRFFDKVLVKYKYHYVDHQAIECSPGHVLGAPHFVSIEDLIFNNQKVIHITNDNEYVPYNHRGG